MTCNEQHTSTNTYKPTPRPTTFVGPVQTGSEKFIKIKQAQLNEHY